MTVESSGQGADSSTDATSDKSFECDSCGKEYKSRYGIKRHLNNNCTNTGFRCEICDKGFPTERGLRYHYSQVHNEPKHRQVECEYCGKVETVAPWKAEQYHYCSNRCNALAAENWEEKATVTDTCSVCNEEYEIEPWLKDKIKTCRSPECEHKHRSKVFSGQDNPAWEGGETKFPKKGWGKRQREIRRRDNYRCQSCGIREKKLDRNLSIHHITPRRKFVDQSGEMDIDSANESSNLVALCQPCHRKWEGIPLRPKLID